jgi:hypothetical protein
MEPRPNALRVGEGEVGLETTVEYLGEHGKKMSEINGDSKG